MHAIVVSNGFIDNRHGLGPMRTAMFCRAAEPPCGNSARLALTAECSVAILAALDPFRQRLGLRRQLGQAVRGLLIVGFAGLLV